MLTSGPYFSIQPGAEPCHENDILLCFCMDDIIVYRKNGEYSLPTRTMLRPYLPGTLTPEFLFSLQQGRQAYGLDLPESMKQGLLAQLKDDVSLEDGLLLVHANIFRTIFADEDAFALITAYHLFVWQRTHRYCGKCGAHPLTPVQTERALRCDRCGHTIYPVISPAVSVAITNGDRLLLARNAHSAFRSFSLIAGYVEVGESLEATIHREVLEEVGLHVNRIRYIGSQGWGWSQALMLGFHAELDGSDQITLQESELSEARWFRRDEIEPITSPRSLSFDMIQLFRKNELP